MGKLRDWIWGSPEARRERQERENKKRETYEKGVAQGRLARTQIDEQALFEKGFHKGMQPQLSKKKRVLKALVGTGKGLGKAIQNYQPPENDPFGLFPNRKGKKKKKKKKRNDAFALF
jgi:hypothetical protein